MIQNGVYYYLKEHFPEELPSYQKRKIPQNYIVDEFADVCEEAYTEYICRKDTMFKSYIDHYIDQIMAQQSFPLFNKIEIETYNRCNNDCSFCPVSRGHDRRPSHFMESALFYDIIGQLSQLKYRGVISLYSNNEPLLDDRIVCPLDKSYLSNYKTRYVDTSADNVAYVYRNSKKTTEDPERLDQGAKVIVIAEEGTSSCIIYKTYQNKPRSGWISKQFLSKTYVGEMLEIGTPTKGEALIGDVEFEYSGEYMKGTECEYLLLDDPIRNCTGFTLEYKVRHSTGNASGGRDVYINNGDGWIWIGDFPYTSAKSYHVEVHLGKPADVYAIAIPPFSTVSGDYDARQNILDVFVLP